jgi:hypothetical protein
LPVPGTANLRLNDKQGFFCIFGNFINLYVMMPQKQFKKLRMYLPRQPLVNQRPWLMAGILLVLLFLLIVIYYYVTAARSALLQQHGEMKEFLKK